MVIYILKSSVTEGLCQGGSNVIFEYLISFFNCFIFWMGIKDLSYIFIKYLSNEAKEDRREDRAEL